MRNILTIVTAGLAIIAGVTPSFAARRASYQAKVSPKFPAVAQTGSIAVLNFNGRDGEAFSGTLTAALQAVRIDGKAVFDVKTMDSMNYRSTADVSRAEVAAAIRLGQKLGVRAVFTGAVTSASTSNSNFTREDRFCAQSKKIFSCERWETRRTPCTTVVGQYAVAPRAIRVDNGSVIYSETITSRGEYTVCEGQLQKASISTSGSGEATVTSNAITSPDGLIDAMRTEVAQRVRLDVAPYYRTITVNFMNRTGQLSKPDNAQFQNALEFAEASRLDRTCAIFETLYATEANKSNVSLLYNMGVCQEVLVPEDLSAALPYYARADQLLTRPDKLVSDAFVRTRNAVEAGRGSKP